MQPSLLLVDEPGVLHHLRQLGQLFQRFRSIVAQQIPYPVHVCLCQNRRITGIFHQILELVEVGQILHRLHRLLETHRFLARKVVAFLPPSLGKHRLKILRELIHLPTQIHVFKQLFRQLLQLCTLLRRHRVEHGLCLRHSLRHCFQQLVEALRIFRKEITKLFHEFLELRIFTIFAPLEHLVQRRHHVFHSRHVLGRHVLHCTGHLIKMLLHQLFAQFLH